jgi:uncharacterized membrane protein YeiB
MLSLIKFIHLSSLVVWIGMIVGYISSVAALATLLVISYAEKTLPIARVLILAIMTVTTFYSGLVVGKRAVSIKAQIKAAEEPAEKESLRAVFKKVHERSSRLNMTVLALGVLLVFLTARGL